jgi:hypothetical protein
MTSTVAWVKPDNRLPVNRAVGDGAGWRGFKRTAQVGQPQEVPVGNRRLWGGVCGCYHGVFFYWKRLFYV